MAATASLSAQHTVFSTHDHTLSIGQPKPIQFHETWADVKTPGGWPNTAVSYPSGFPMTTDRRVTYATGTIEVHRTDGSPLFSGSPASTGTPTTGNPVLLPFGPVLSVPFKRQVVMTQWNNTFDNTINRQRYFYGLTGGSGSEGTDFTRATNARAISVWQTSDAATTRVAICGETYDQRLPGCQSGDAAGWPNSSPMHPTGFIAVYDGAGSLLWTHHFLDPNAIDVDCAITDVSIRVDGKGEDVVTYCGISTHGGLAGGQLDPLAPFAPVLTCTGGDPGAASSAGQWDAFVGRVVSSGAGTSQRVFHSIVFGGGTGEDLLMGIAELDENRFAVAGSTHLDEGASEFPFTTQCGFFVGPFVMGTVMLFDASAVGTGGNLQLVSSEPLGHMGANLNTVARDISVGRSMLIEPAASYPFGDSEVLYVVGSTDNYEPASGAGAFSSGWFPFQVQPPTGQDQLQGPTDGFIAAMVVNQTLPALQPWSYSYHGGDGYDGLTGVNGWSEFNEHVSVTGWSDYTTTSFASVDIDVGTYFFNNAATFPAGTPLPGTFVGPPNGTGQLLRVRRYRVGGSNEDRPAVMGPRSATTNGLAIHDHANWALGQESGGGVSVCNDGRVNVVGRTTNPAGVQSYPAIGGGRSPDFLTDAVRTELDPVERQGPAGAFGTGRTDGTGHQSGVVGPFPPLPSTGLTGGTTPFCALSQFAVRNGVPPTTTWLPRMLVDVEGPLTPSSNSAAILIVRPPASPGSLAFGGLEFGVPVTTPFAHILGTEYWLGGSTSYVYFTALPSNQSFRLPLATLTPGVGPVTAQLSCLLMSPLAGPGCSTFTPASPALWFNW